MKSRSYLWGLCLSTVFALSACELYLGEHRGHRDGRNGGGNDSWTECRNDGLYLCNWDGCRWQSESCEVSYPCGNHEDCASGCYCGAGGTCVEAGYCNDNRDCGNGFVCDVPRGSCVPDTNQCNSPDDCGTGQTCNTTTHTCVPVPAACGDRIISQGEVCDDGNRTAGDGCSADCKSKEVCGNGIVDNVKGEQCDDGNQVDTDACTNTCKLPSAGSCAGAITCNIAPPSCPVDKVPLIKNGCYTGQCQLISACDAAPKCEALRQESACSARMDCNATYNGINCRRADGTTCTGGDTNCTCERFVFATCRTDM